ncbi:hypothetical protein, variant [Verruconis gallopava]|uniref:DNA replication ATP-dependent helicase/nuclease n=1 Tax=Verruconis gallopava TaxID=253628 RepID=A0A0D2B613_9PEZI|nr:hypothetical protein, variant [Verruconis gallopava]KIW06674.1 hypothetical protein, variant [Verruconis gallopava]
MDGVQKPGRPCQQRTRSANDVSHDSHCSPSKPTTSRPNITPNARNKTKPKAFQFIDGRPSSQQTSELEKENYDLAGQDVVLHQQASQTPLKSSSQPEPVDRKLPPSTPAPRLPLADLLGNADEKRRAVASNVTPEEHVLWAHVQTPGSSQRAITPARKRKRAKSSSPAPSSQQEQLSNSCNDNHGAANLDRLQLSLATPHVDPAADLWQRYANGPEGAVADKSAAFAYLIRDPSPKSPASAGSVGGLRRWASCGVEWPQSATKRRRIARRTEELPQHKEENEGGKKGSRVGALLERMKETLTKSVQAPLECPSSSSPLPDRVLRQDELPFQQHLSPVQEQIGDRSPSPTKQKSPEPVHKYASSDCGDDKADADMIDAFSTTKNVHPARLNTKPLERRIQPRSKRNTPVPSSARVRKPFVPPKMIKQPSASVASVKSPVADTVVSRQQSQSDDFFDDDDDDDLLEVDLDKITAEFNSQQRTVQASTSKAQVASQPSSRPPIPEASEAKVEKPAEIIQVISDDEFGDDDIDEEQFAAVEAAATQAFQVNDRSTHANCEVPSVRTIQRYHITAIHEAPYLDEHGRQQLQKVLRVDEPRADQTRTILLRQSWFETPATVGSYVHVIGEFDAVGQCIVDNTSNILILHPDHLISATVVADSFGCVRRAVLQDRVKVTSEATPPMMYGHILHELFQEAMKANEWTDDSFEKYMRVILPRHYDTMVEIGLNLNQVHEYLRSKFPEMRAWAELFVCSSPRRDAVIKGRNGQQAIMSINKLLDVEEHIWSPNYGLKGNVDATVQATIRDGGSSRVLTVPFELKTGKRVNENHVAQTALYTLLTSDRYDVEITEGILYYLESSHIMRVQAIRHELIHLIMKRNELACYVRERLKLPPMLPESKQRLCNNCYAQTTCFLYHKLAEDGTSQTIANKGRFEELVRYLKPVDQIFFQKWDQLLTKEETEMKRFTRELWTMLSHEREKKGRCFGEVIIEPGTAIELPEAMKINRFQYTFIKKKNVSGFSFTESQITVGEPIVISDEKGHYALANGYVTHVHKNRITVAVDRRLHNARTRRPGFHSQTNQDFTGVMEVLATQETDGTEPALYRIDKDEFSNGMATARNNMLQIMDDTIYRASDIRAMIVQDRPPTFKLPASAIPLQSETWQAEMNSDQRAAIEQVMAAQDYALVLGMPGTGKTTTIAQIIRALVAKGKSVLLTSYTHTAVDNILLKLRDAGFDVLRLGVLAKVHPQVREFVILDAQQKESLEDVQNAWYNPAVVATTCLGVNHPIFHKRTFDYCIVDEASQITLPVCLGPIRMAKTFILVGDHFQLPPLVQNKEALEGGLDMSLFRLLSERHPEAVVNLEHQYRMCADIMYLSNTLIYNGRLKCGTPAVAQQSLQVPYPEQSLRIHHFPIKQQTLSAESPCVGPSSTCHLHLALQPQSKILFFNTDNLLPASSEVLSGTRITNPFEAVLTSQFVLTLLDAGINAADIGVITFYRSQLAELRHILRSQPSIELHTADKFQGRDKEAVVISFVRSNQDENVGELLKDWRRINVAITRARTKLILVGSKKTLSNGGEVLKGLLDICEQKGWMHNLVAGEHCFPELATQVSGITQGSPLRKSNTTPRKQLGREVLGELNVNKLNQGNRKAPEKRGRINEKGIFGSRPVMKDIANDILDGIP